MAEIIVITYGQSALEKRCLDSIRKHTNLSLNRLTVVDNFSLDQNLGSLWNDLIERSFHEYVCLLNTDTVVEEGWLDKLTESALELDADAVGPVTNNCGFSFQIRAKQRRKTVRPVRTLSGFCLLLSKAAWRRVKGFREDFPFYGQESNLLDRMGSTRLFLREDVLVRHDGGGTFRKQSVSRRLIEGQLRREFYQRNKNFDWSQRLLVLGSGAGNQFPLWRGIDQAGVEFAREGMAFLHSSAYDRPAVVARVIADFEPSCIIVCCSKVDRIAGLHSVLSSSGAQTALWVCDLRSAPPQQKLRRIAGALDAVFLCWYGSYEWARQNCSTQVWADWARAPVHYMPQGSIIRTKLEPLDIKHECVFIGGIADSIHRGRRKVVEHLREHIEMVVVNERARTQRLLVEKRTQKIYRNSRFCLVQSPPADGYQSLRLYNVLCNGGLALVHRFPGCDLLLEDGLHCRFFETPEEAVEIVRQENGLDGQLEAIRKTGWRLGLSKHTAAARLMNMAQTLNRPGPHEFWGWL